MKVMAEKLKSENVKPIVIIACRVFQSLLTQLLPDNLQGVVQYLDYGLHVHPKSLTTELQKSIDDISQPSLVVFGYGLCGNGLEGLKSKVHTLLIPRTDDCIALLLGSSEAYQQVFTSEPGTYYLTKGWLEGGSNPLQEYREYIERFGVEKSEMIMDLQYKNYTRLMFVAHSQEELNTYQDQVKPVAEYCRQWGMRYEERIGDDGYIRNLIKMTVAFAENDGFDQITGYENDFVVVKPGDIVQQSAFLR